MTDAAPPQPVADNADARRDPDSERVARVAVLIVAYNSEQDLEECIGSVLASNDTGVAVRVFLVDNASPDASGKIVRERFPDVDLITLEENLGFAGGNNAGWAHIQRVMPEINHLVLLNPDTAVRDGWLRALVDVMDAEPNVAAAQSMLLLHPSVLESNDVSGHAEAGSKEPTGPALEDELINTAGNRSHFLGFGYTTGYKQSRAATRAQYNASHPIDFPSGAAVMLRAHVIRELGLFDDAFFLYLEDADLGWKLRLAGYELRLTPKSIVLHKYNANAPLRAYYFMERNRWWLLLTYYRLPTLLLLAPALFLMECGQYFFAMIKGVFGQKLRACAAVMSPSSWKLVLRRRRETRRWRRLGDRELTKHYSGVIRFESIDHPLLTYVGNPLFRAYWAVARRLIFW